MITEIIPNRCAIGRASRPTSPAWMPSVSASVVAFQCRLALLIITPFGRPVVPPVYMITARSSSAAVDDLEPSEAASRSGSRLCAPSGVAARDQDHRRRLAGPRWPAARCRGTPGS